MRRQTSKNFDFIAAAPYEEKKEETKDRKDSAPKNPPTPV